MEGFPVATSLIGTGSDCPPSLRWSLWRTESPRGSNQDAPISTTPLTCGHAIDVPERMLNSVFLESDSSPVGRMPVGGLMAFGEEPRAFSSVGNGNCGFQFLHDMVFELSVLHGAGLPPSLNQPPPWSHQLSRCWEWS